MSKRKADETSGEAWAKIGLPIKLMAKKHETEKAALPFRSSVELYVDVLVVKLPFPQPVTHKNGRTKKHGYRDAMKARDRDFAQATIISNSSSVSLLVDFS